MDRQQTAVHQRRIDLDIAHLLSLHDAGNFARVAYNAAKSVGRIAKAKQAHDDVIGAVYRAQADALEIEALAKRRLADEYDGAQDRGEVATQGKHSRTEGLATASEIGLSHKDIYKPPSVFFPYFVAEGWWS